MHLSKRFAVTAITLAIAPVAAEATILFQDNFDDGNASSRYDVYSFENTSPITRGPGVLGDTAIDWAFNYGNYTYRRLAANQVDLEFNPIPSAPNSGGTTIGLRMDVNNDSTSGTAIINAYPKLAQFTSGLPSGDYKLTFDLWINYNGGEEGGAGSTEWFVAGINQVGGGIGGPVIVDNPSPLAGQSMAMNGERGNTNDYRFYQANTRLGTLDASTGYVAQSEVVGTATYGVADARNSFYQTLFPKPTYETGGAPGKKWVQVDISYVDGIVYYSMNGTLLAARTDSSSTSGNILLGYADFNSSSAAKEIIFGQEVDANFVVYDNVKVETVTQVRPRYVGTPGGVWSNAANWVNGVPDGKAATADFGPSLAAGTINVDGPRSVRSVVFDNANSLTLGGAGPLKIDALTTGIRGTVVVKQGSHTLAVPLQVERDLTFNIAAGSGLTVTSDLPSTTWVYRKSGSGTLSVKNLRTTTVAVEGGTLAITANGTDVGTSKVSALTIGSGAKLDLNDNDMVIDYTTTSVADTVRLALLSGRGAGNWDGSGIISGIAAADSGKAKALAAVEAADLLGLSGAATATWSGQTVDATSVLITLTYYGDMNLDGRVNADDFALMDRSVAKNLPAKWLNGDFNYDNLVNAADYALMDRAYANQGGPLSPGFLAMREAQFGADYVAELVASVPEPSALLGLVAAPALGLLKRRRR